MVLQHSSVRKSLLWHVNAKVGIFISYSTIVLFSRDHAGVGVKYPKTSLNSPIWRYGSIGKVKPNLQIDPRRFQQVATEFYLTEFSTE